VDERALRHRLAHREFREQRVAGPGRQQRPHQGAVVDPQVVAGLHLAGSRPAVQREPGRHLGRVDEQLFLEILRMRHAVRTARATTDDRPGLEQPAHDTLSLRRRADADGQVDAIGDRFPVLVGQVDLERDGRVHLPVPNQESGERGARQERRGRDLQAARGACRFGLRFGDRLTEQAQTALRLLEQPRSGIGQRELAGGAVDQLRSQGLLERRNGLAGKRGGDPQIKGGGAKGAGPRHGSKYRQRAQRIDVGLHAVRSFIHGPAPLQSYPTGVIPT
jgi:hypothetical protein